MNCLQSRIDSFSRPVKVQNSANTGPVKKLKWPHPPSFIANPLSPAEAGFYFDPSYDERDNVTCFVCGKELAGWDDDTFDIHWKKSAKACPWAVVRCALKADLDSSGRFAFSDKNRFPSSKLLEKARLQIFAVGDGWIHDQVRNHGANSKQMAKAGFLFTPQHPDDDSATCLYCNLSLNERDSTDDPLDEHHKRKGTVCPFFIGSVSSSNAPATSSSTRSTRSSSTKSSSRISAATTTRGHGRPIMPDIIEDTIEPLAPPADAGPSKKHGKKASRSKSRSRKTIHEEPAEDDDEQADEEQQPKRKSRASARSLSRSVSRKKDPSSRKKKTVPPVSKEDKEESDDATSTGSTVTRSRSRKPTVAQQPDTNEHETKHSALTKSKKSSSRTGSRSKVASLEGCATTPEEVPEEDSDDRHGEEEKPSSRVDTKSKDWEDDPVIDKVEEQQVLELPKARKTSISSGRSTTIVREKNKTTTEMVGGGDGKGQEAFTFTNSEDEIEADLEGVQWDDTVTDDRVVEELPQELGVIDEVSFAPRLVTKAFSEAEQRQQQQRPRTPNLVPFTEVAGTMSSSPGRLYLGTNAAGPEEKTPEVEVEKIPKTPQRKIVISEGDPITFVWSADNLTMNPGVDVVEVEHPALRSTPEQIEEKNYHHRTLQQGQEPFKTQKQPVELQFVPFLSKLPFVPLHMLAKVELDMTVEDWIRYQMEVEYDKFKRDGERELMRFKKKVEETRRIIEEL